MMIKVTAKKSLGQNFLVNPHILERIIEAARIKPGDTIVEIGPGTGALTEKLAVTGARIIAVEKDRRLIEPLREKFLGTNVDIIEADILRFDMGHLSDRNYKIVANIPYYLTSHLIRLMFTAWPRPSLAILMVQEEVAQRMLAAPPEMNLLALSVQLYSQPSLVARVSRNSFRPVPDVDSAVVALEISDSDWNLNEKALGLARPAFGQKRKQLTATLPKELLEKSDIDPKTRPQNLTVRQWLDLASASH